MVGQTQSYCQGTGEPADGRLCMLPCLLLKQPDTSQAPSPDRIDSLPVSPCSSLTKPLYFSFFPSSAPHVKKGFIPLPVGEICSLLLSHSAESAGVEEEEANGCMEKTKNGKKSASQFS